jgi:DNA-binding transcriptional regulator YiaG
MTTRRVAKYVDWGFGFPVVLEQVPMVQVRGKWMPDLNYTQLARAVLRQLAVLNGRLTGQQVRFVRLHFDLTLQAFATRFGVSHVAVLKWEHRGNKPTGMTWSTEKDLRLFIQQHLSGQPREFFQLYEQLVHVTSPHPSRITLQAEKLAA